MGWVGRIGLLYACNAARLEVIEQPRAFAEKRPPEWTGS